jgi:hypothetical protein
MKYLILLLLTSSISLAITREEIYKITKSFEDRAIQADLKDCSKRLEKLIILTAKSGRYYVTTRCKFNTSVVTLVKKYKELGFLGKIDSVYGTITVSWED